MDKLKLLVLLLAVILSTCARPPRADSAFTFPADQPVSNGNAVSKLCGRCCQDDSYCGQLTEDISLADESNSSQGRVREFPKGSNLTCLLRARDVFGAVDGGLCVPSILAVDKLPETFCTTFDQVLDVCLRALQNYAQANMSPPMYLRCVADITGVLHAHQRHLPSWVDRPARLWYLL